MFHIERLDHLPKKLLLVQITPPNVDNGRFIIEWGNELPPDVLLSNLKGHELSANVPKAVGAAWELTNNSLHEVFNYNTLILGAIQGRSYEGRIVAPGLCRTESADLTTRLPETIRNIFGAFLGRRFYCRQNTWWGGLKRDGSRVTMSLFESSLHPSASYYSIVVDELRHAGLVELSHR